MNKEDGTIREISFNNLNHAVTIKSNHKEDTLEKLKKIAFEVLEKIQEERNKE